MVEGKKVIVVMPAYNAEKTLRRTHGEVLAQEIVDLVIVVDDKTGDPRNYSCWDFFQQQFVNTIPC